MYTHLLIVFCLLHIIYSYLQGTVDYIHEESFRTDGYIIISFKRSSNFPQHASSLQQGLLLYLEWSEHLMDQFVRKSSDLSTLNALSKLHFQQIPITVILRIQFMIVLSFLNAKSDPSQTNTATSRS